MHEEIKGFGQDEEQTQELVRKAAEQGDADAQNRLGVMYYRGEGVEQMSGGQMR